MELILLIAAPIFIGAISLVNKDMIKQLKEWIEDVKS